MKVLILAESHEDRLIKIIEYYYMKDLRYLQEIALDKAKNIGYSGAIVSASDNGKKTIYSVQFTKRFKPSLYGEGETLPEAIDNALEFVNLPLEGVLNTEANKRITAKINKLKQLVQ